MTWSKYVSIFSDFYVDVILVYANAGGKKKRVEEGQLLDQDVDTD